MEEPPDPPKKRLEWEDYLAQDHSSSEEPQPIEDSPSQTTDTPEMKPQGRKFGNLKQEIQTLKTRKSEEESPEKGGWAWAAIAGGVLAAVLILGAWAIWMKGSTETGPVDPLNPKSQEAAASVASAPQEIMPTFPQGDSPPEQAQAVLETSEEYLEKLSKYQDLSAKNLEVAQRHENLLARMLSFQLRVTQGRADPKVREALSETRSTLTQTLTPYHTQVVNLQTSLPEALSNLKATLADLENQTQQQKILEDRVQQMQKETPSSPQLPIAQEELRKIETQIQDSHKNLQETAQKVHREISTLSPPTVPTLPNLTVQTQLREGSLRTDTIKEGTIHTITQKPKTPGEQTAPLLSANSPTPPTSLTSPTSPSSPTSPTSPTSTTSPTTLTQQAPEPNPETNIRVGIPPMPQGGVAPVENPTTPARQAIPLDNSNILQPPSQGSTNPSNQPRVSLPPTPDPLQPSSPRVINPPLHSNLQVPGAPTTPNRPPTPKSQPITEKNPNLKNSPTQTQDLLWQWQ